MCVCVYVSNYLLVNKIPDKQMHQFVRGFCLAVAYCIDSDSIEIGDLAAWVKDQGHNGSISIFLHNSLLTSIDLSSLMSDQTKRWHAA